MFKTVKFVLKIISVLNVNKALISQLLEHVRVLLSLRCPTLQTTHVFLATSVIAFSVTLIMFVQHAHQDTLPRITTVLHAPSIIVFHVH